jgi:hypothetical protein
MATESTSQKPELRLSHFNHAGSEGAARKMCSEGDARVKSDRERMESIPDDRSTSERLQSLIKTENPFVTGLLCAPRQDFIDRLVVREDSPLRYCPAPDDRLPGCGRPPGNVVDGAARIARGQYSISFRH